MELIITVLHMIFYCYILRNALFFFITQYFEFDRLMAYIQYTYVIHFYPS